jgi:hypothetical protein
MEASNSWNPQDLSRPVMGLLYLYLYRDTPQYAIYTTGTIHSTLFLARQPSMGQGLLIHDVYISHTKTHHTRLDSPGRGDQLFAETSTRQHTTLTRDIHAPGEIRTHNLSKREATDLRLRPHGHSDRHILRIPLHKYITVRQLCYKPKYR